MKTIWSKREESRVIRCSFCEKPVIYLSQSRKTGSFSPNTLERFCNFDGRYLCYTYYVTEELEKFQKRLKKTIKKAVKLAMKKTASRKTPTRKATT